MAALIESGDVGSRNIKANRSAIIIINRDYMYIANSTDIDQILPHLLHTSNVSGVDSRMTLVRVTVDDDQYIYHFIRQLKMPATEVAHCT